MLDVIRREREMDDLRCLMGDTQKPSSWEIIAIDPGSVEPQGELLAEWLDLRDHVRNTANVNPYDPYADEFTVTASDEDDRDLDEELRLTSLSQRLANGKWSHLRHVNDIDIREHVDNTMLHDAEHYVLETPESGELVRRKLHLEALIAEQRAEMLADAVDEWVARDMDDLVEHYDKVHDQRPARRKPTLADIQAWGERAVADGDAETAQRMRDWYRRKLKHLRTIQPQAPAWPRPTTILPRKNVERLQRTTSKVGRNLVQIDGIWMERHVDDDKAMDDPKRVFHTLAQHVPNPGVEERLLAHIVECGKAATDEDERDRLRAAWLYHTTVQRKRDRRLAENAQRRRKG